MLLLALLGATLAMFASPVRAADWSASAGWGLRLDNHLVTSGGTAAQPAQTSRFSPWTQAITPTFALAMRPLGARLDAEAKGRLEVGAPVPGEGLGPLRRGSSAEAHAGLERTFGDGLHLAGYGSMFRSRDLLDVDHATVSADADAARWTASARGDARWFKGEWRLRGWRSDTAVPVDTRSQDMGARVFLVQPAALALFVGAGEQRMDRDQDILLLSRRAVLGVRRDVVPGLAAVLEAGALTERIGFSEPTLRPTAAIEIASPRDDGAGGWFRFRIARALGTEFESELGRRGGRASAWVRASSTVDLEGSGAVAPAVIQRATLAVADTLAEATVLGFEASVARNRSYRGLPLTPVASARVGAWVERMVQPWLACRAGWDLLLRDENTVNDLAAADFRRSRFEIQIRAYAR